MTGTGLMAPPSLGDGIEATRTDLLLPRPRLPRLRLRLRLRVRVRAPRPGPDAIADVCFLAGLAAIAAGCGWIFPPAAPIVGGVFLAAVAWIEQRGRRAEEEQPPPATRAVERWYVDPDEDD